MTVLEAVEAILTEAGEPLHYTEITRRILARELWKTEGKTPEETVNARLSVDIKNKKSSSLFRRTDKGTFALCNWGFQDFDGKTIAIKPESLDEIDQPNKKPRYLSFTDATEYVLDKFANKKSMHYREITSKALELGLLKTKGQTPEATLYAQVLSEIGRQNLRGETPRFFKHGRGRLSLSRWLPQDIPLKIEQHNNEVRQKLHAQLQALHPSSFEELIDKLLVKLGFAEIERTSYSGDGGIDVRGTLVVGDVIRIRMAVQVKRWKNNVQAPIVQQVRGSLGTHEQGLIVTTSDFSEGARKEAERPNAVPVALMNGEQLVTQLVEHDLGVHRTAYTLISLGEDKEE
jgi:restriction system protein